MLSRWRLPVGRNPWALAAVSISLLIPVGAEAGSLSCSGPNNAFQLEPVNRIVVSSNGGFLILSVWDQADTGTPVEPDHVVIVPPAMSCKADGIKLEIKS
jgi:hypothetical protein